MFPSQATHNRTLLSVTAVLCAVFAWALSATAQEISEVTIQTRAGEPFAEEVVPATIHSREGTEFDAEILSQDIERLYKTGLITDVEATYKTQADGTVAITFTVVPVPRVNAIIIEGNDYLSDGKIRDKITVKTGERLDRKAVAESRLAVETMYDRKGYHGSTVEIRETPMPQANKVNLLFQVKENPRYKLRSVDFAGNKVFSDRKLRGQMQTDPTFWSHIFPAGFFAEQKLQADRQRLQSFYAGHGYLDFNISNIERKYSSNRQWISIVIHVVEGPQYTVDSVAVAGHKKFGSGELMPLVTLAAGDVYDPRTVNRDIQAIKREYGPLGYIDLSVRPLVQKDTATDTVDVTYQITEGTPARIRDITIIGNEVTKDEVIRRELRIMPGEPADPQKIRTSEAVLRNLQYFETVSISPKSTPVDDLKDLEVRVKEQRTGQLMAGAGISSEENIVGTLEIAQRNFDWRDWPTLTGGGQRVRMRLQLGTESNEFSFSFVEPWWLDRRLRLELNAMHVVRDEDEYSRTTTGGAASVTRKWLTNWRQSIGYRINLVSLDEFEDDASQELRDEEGDYTVSALTFSLSRDTRDRVVNPTRGSQLGFHLDLQPEALGGYTNLYRLDMEGTKYFPVIERGVLKVRGELGVVDEMGGGDPVAIFDRYFAGGSSSFRGFDRREISPVDVNGDSVGGQSIFLGSAEFIYQVVETVYASVFSDFGNVWRDAYDWQPDEINVSVGLGLQLDLPIGPIRLDYGWPIVVEDDELDTGGRLHFKLGYYF
ncbi:MAG: outer membrane protein assembly factor BamA [Candidatus Pacebacteria bacterium]|nr:outer membrane protein assembly factor BamA [Candidatus Paceibacterota bacterium]